VKGICNSIKRPNLRIMGIEEGECKEKEFIMYSTK
jgi:hypothetical protein